ncbi:uncharacterized protein LY79DRAFT_534742 [Colletotrichum navitas]|uniref:Secreted protein n=1 Tax=Colletotrichum navitas TaxID=681940 RepID=A0AAD8V9H5_9PEZI|nr:uncharacterized protein LY79DRAFT_534742 [Colletotrichum navitas]KAK1599312.1 hypothetical protein LY79DRAFT_534742 [Colletotrichum navitas]
MGGKACKACKAYKTPSRPLLFWCMSWLSFLLSRHCAVSSPPPLLLLFSNCDRWIGKPRRTAMVPKKGPSLASSSSSSSVPLTRRLDRYHRVSSYLASPRTASTPDDATEQQRAKTMHDGRNAH